MNKSPWLEQLDQYRVVNEIAQDLETDIAVVGGGIAGMTTAYFLLKNTNKKVALVEAGKIAHGATGHNAGQVLAYLEKPFHEIAKEHGKKMAIKAMDAIEGAWDLLQGMIEEAKLSTPLYKFSGYTGYSTFQEVLDLLELDHLNAQAGLNKEQILIADNAEYLGKIPAKYKKYYAIIPQKEILDKLDTNNHKYTAVGVMLKGCMNSALFVEELAGYLLRSYPERFRMYEHSPVEKIILNKVGAHLMVKKFLLIAQRVVLCTNGFENINVVDLISQKVDYKYHQEVKGVVGYMAGYKEKSDKSPGAFAYFEGQFNQKEAPYFYLTRRPYHNFDDGKSNLVTIGGPETFLPDNAAYDREHIYPMEAKEQIDKFIKGNIARDVREDIDYRFFWHGLMGYTKSGLRMIGPDPCNPVLLYNLGCNGVGILTSVFGSKRVSQFISRKKLSAMIFDPYRDIC
ncbi:FAD-binding oxidoreductase [Candidatus Peregrinibacteria bacterium]|nr:FAD-binding oxidoreductase [Candidatus Peregrinibacteria bacterium]